MNVWGGSSNLSKEPQWRGGVKKGDMHIRIFVAGLLALGFVMQLDGRAQAPPPSPFEGRWTADLSASQIHPALAVRSIVLTFVVSPDRVRITDDVVDRSGKQIGVGTTELVTDGQEHRNDALLPGLVVQARWASPRRLETVLKRPSGVIERVSYETSADGRTLTNTTEGPLGSQRIVFRR